jgi:hypothetical protein
MVLRSRHRVVTGVYCARMVKVVVIRQNRFEISNKHYAFSPPMQLNCLQLDISDGCTSLTTWPLDQDSSTFKAYLLL